MQSTNPVDGKIITEEEIQTFLAEKLAMVLRTTPDQIDIHDNLATYGLDSLDAMVIMGKLSDKCGVELDFDVLWDYPSLVAVSKFVINKIKDNA